MINSVIQSTLKGDYNLKISPKEAEEALSDIHKITRKTRHAVSSSGAYIFLIYTGLVWLAGFLGNQFLPEAQARILWAGAGLLEAYCPLSPDCE